MRSFIDDAAPRILIADDEPAIVLSLEFLMRRNGFVVDVARDGDDAIAKAATFNPTLVLLDVMLPRRDGMEVCRTLRAKCGPGLKIVLLTAKGGQADLDRGLSMGADLYIVKPFSTQELVASVKQLLDVEGP
jgi:DNA-binding response OmpR family regulator